MQTKKEYLTSYSDSAYYTFCLVKMSHFTTVEKILVINLLKNKQKVYDLS